MVVGERGRPQSETELAKRAWVSPGIHYNPTPTINMQRKLNLSKEGETEGMCEAPERRQTTVRRPVICNPPLTLGLSSLQHL